MSRLTAKSERTFTEREPMRQRCERNEYLQSRVTDTGSEVFLVDGSGFPGEWLGALAVAVDEVIDLSSDVSGRCAAGTAQGGSAEDEEPDFHLVHLRLSREADRRGRGEVEMHVGMTRQPQVSLGLVSVQVVEHDVDVAAWVGCHDAVHEVEELNPSPAPIVPRLDLPGRDVERGERSGGAVPPVVMALPGQRPAIGQLEVSLRALQRPARSVFCARRTRQTYWSLMSPRAAASSRPVQRSYPAGGG